MNYDRKKFYDISPDVHNKETWLGACAIKHNGFVIYRICTKLVFVRASVSVADRKYTS